MEAFELAGHVRAKELSPVEVVEAVLERMEKLEPALHAFCTPTPEMARAEAHRLEKEISDGRDPGPLAGVPVGIKDLHAVKGVRMALGSHAYEDFVPDEDEGVHLRLTRLVTQRKPVRPSTSRRLPVFGAFMALDPTGGGYPTLGCERFPS